MSTKGGIYWKLSLVDRLTMKLLLLVLILLSTGQVSAEEFFWKNAPMPVHIKQYQPSKIGPYQLLLLVSDRQKGEDPLLSNLALKASKLGYYTLLIRPHPIATEAFAPVLKDITNHYRKHNFLFERVMIVTRGVFAHSLNNIWSRNYAKAILLQPECSSQLPMWKSLSKMSRAYAPVTIVQDAFEPRCSSRHSFEFLNSELTRHFRLIQFPLEDPDSSSQRLSHSTVQRMLLQLLSQFNKSQRI